MDHEESGLSTKTSKELTRIALDANITLQAVLIEKAQKLEEQLKEIDLLLEAQEVEDEPESEIAIPGSKRAVGLFPSSEFLNPLSPFYDEATRRNNYIMNNHPRPLKEKELEVLADAVKKENERLQALHCSFSGTETERSLDGINDIDALDWNRIAERVSDASSGKRNATECRVTWVANRPCVNRTPWTPSELQHLHSLIPEYPPNKVNWVEVAEKLGTNRIPLDCMRREIFPQRHYWTPYADQRLTKAVETYGIDNWHLVAIKVAEHVTPSQCQARWCKTLDPSLRRGAWTEEEDNRLRKAVAGYGTSWVQLASAVPGRTNDQCRERWLEYLNVGPHQTWTDEEDIILLAAVAEFGARWKEISLKVGNKKTGQACRRRYDKLKKAQKTTLSTGSAAQTSTMSIYQESAPIPLPTSKSGGESTPSTSTVLPAAGPSRKPQPRPRPRRKGVTAGHSCAVVTVDAHDSAITIPAPASPLPEQAIPRLPQPTPRNTEATEINHTTVGIDMEQNPPGSSADSQSESRTNVLTREGKRKAAGKSEIATSSKKLRRMQTNGSPLLTGVGTSTESVSAVDTKANTELVKLRRGRSAARIQSG